MKIKLAKKTKIIAITLIGTLLIGIVTLIIINNKNTKECDNCTIKSHTINSAYDYILDEMSKPEYWGVEHMYDYFSEDEVQKRLETIPNGSGWYLSDPKTASFSRGYDCVMTYNFSNFTVRSDDGVFIEELDFKNNQKKTYKSSDPNNPIEVKDNLIECTDPREDTIYFIDHLGDKVSFIKNSMMNYAYLFEQAGCPILLQPEGTLESYKNKKPTPVLNYQILNTIWKKDYYHAREEETDYWGDAYADDTLINAPWELDDYYYDLRDNPNLQWIEDYTEVNEIVKTLPEVSSMWTQNHDMTYIPIVFINLNKYDEYKEQTGMLPNVTSNIVAYVVKPMLEAVYGKDIVYFCDMKNLKDEVLLPNNWDINDDNFDKIGFPNGQDSCDGVIEIYKSPQPGWENARYNFCALEDVIVEEGYGEVTLSATYLAASVEDTNENAKPTTSSLYSWNMILTLYQGDQEYFGLR